jgi:hypothetical protein
MPAIAARSGMVELAASLIDACSCPQGSSWSGSVGSFPSCFGVAGSCDVQCPGSVSAASGAGSTTHAASQAARTIGNDASIATSAAATQDFDDIQS